MNHIVFKKVDLTPKERRKKSGFGKNLNKDYTKHGKSLMSQVDCQSKESFSIATKLRFSPYLVVKVELEPEVTLTDDNISKLESMGLKVIDVENKELMVLFADDYELKEFKQALENYKNGIIARTKVENEDLFAAIKSVTRWSEIDRRGQDLDKLCDIDYIDCYLWIFDFLQETQNKSEELIADSKDHCIKYCDKYISQSVAIVRFKINKDDIKYFLSHPLIYRIDKIPNYQIKRTERTLIKDINLSSIKYSSEHLSESSPSICVIDSGILSGHPLIKDCMGDGKVFYATQGYTPNENDIDGHGTMVAGICEYGVIDINTPFLPRIKIFNAKVHDGIYIGDFNLCLNELKEEKITLSLEQEDLLYKYFTNEMQITELMSMLGLSKRKAETKSIILKYTNLHEKLIPTQMREIVEYFFNNYGCRIFNLSQGDLLSPYDDGKPRAWTCVLDELQNEYDILFVVSTGNYTDFETLEFDDEAFKKYPTYFFEKSKTRVIDPGASITSITVGGLATCSIPFNMQDNQLNVLPISKGNEISTVTRIGPGIGKSIKPDFVAYSGDQAYNTISKRFAHNIALQILSLSNNLTSDGLFSWDYGTSFAAPYVSHISALVIEKYPEASNNLVRAVLACSARIPIEVYQQIEKIASDKSTHSALDKHYTHNVKSVVQANKNKMLHYTVGYGYPNQTLAVDSFDNHVVLLADMKDSNAILPDKTHIFEVPIPPEFINAKGKKRIIVTLAYNPNVRKTRLDYMGCSMGFELIRGQSLEEIYDVCSSQAGKDKEDKAERFEKKYICTMENSKKSLREHGTLQRGVFEFTRSDYGELYYLVVDCKKNWSEETQNYAVAVTYEVADDSVKLYSLIKNRIQIRERERH